MVYGNGMISPTKRVAPRREVEDADRIATQPCAFQEDATLPDTKIPAPAWRAAVSER
jgi:hypothetical protein